ncbi:chromatin modification-related protein EAF7-domain-containing protein [Cladochytrium replicatum]|nr:chromatin modification-related protein EAF7-domain-containing protein [Cladochytrium replicatum]
MTLGEPEWTPEMDVVLLQAITRFRPVGVHKHFRMVSVLRFFNRNSPRSQNAQQLWEHLEDFFDLNALDALADESDDDVPLEVRSKRSVFPFKFRSEFALPFDEFEPVMNERRMADPSPAPSSTAVTPGARSGRGTRMSQNSPDGSSSAPSSPVMSDALDEDMSTSPSPPPPPVQQPKRRGRKPKIADPKDEDDEGSSKRTKVSSSTTSTSHTPAKRRR